MDRLIVYIVVFAALILMTNCTSLTDVRIRILLQRVNTINNLLGGIQAGRFQCNATMYTVSGKVDKMAELVQHLYKGPLLTKMDLSRGYDDKKKILLQLPSAMEMCMKSYEGTPVSPEQAKITCLQQILWRYEVPMRARDIRRARAVVRQNSVNIYKIRPRPPRRVRREYRTLSQKEREDFQKAMNELYEDGTIEKYATDHRVANRGAHRGPGFLPWHRAFITSFETALRTKNQILTLPYWDSTLDYEMASPVDSIMWTKKLVGRGSGIVGEPFPNWYTNLGPLERQYGVQGSLVKRKNVEDMNTRCSFSEINSPLGEGKYKLEGFHNGVHLWVGGAMKAVGTSPYDPVFYLHHAYIDYLWEKWRKIQEDCGNDPETDYVDDSVIPNPERQYQCYNCEMLTMEHYNISDGLSNRWTRFYFRYEDSPTCENDCGGSNLLYCNEMKNMCLPIRRIGSAALVKSFPLPGSGASAPDPILKLRANVQCDKFLDPNCNNLRANLLEEADEPLQPWDELQTIEQMVPINQGELFAAGERDSRSLWTMKEDIEEFDKELAMFRASRRLSVARRPPAAG